MLLQALNEFYERATQGDSPLMDEPAFNPKAIRWIIPLDRAGKLEGIGLIETPKEKNRHKEFKRTPRGTRPKNAGGVSEFLADGLAAIFGLEGDPEAIEPNERKRARQAENLRAKHEDFWRQIRQAFETLNDARFAALLRFAELYLTPDETGSPRVPPFLRWGRANEADEDENPSWWVKTSTSTEAKLGADNFTFQVDDDILIEDESVQEYWRTTYTTETEERDERAASGLCIVTGKTNVPIMKTHIPKIVGVPGSRTTGAVLVSFYEDSYTSYGFDKGENAPVSTVAVSAYANALNWLLRSRNHSLRTNNTVLCFWARESDELSGRALRLLDQPRPEAVRDFLLSPFAGDKDRAPLKHERFYSVVLSGNTKKDAVRVVVRHWMQTTVEAAVKSIQQWFEDLNIVSFSSKNETLSEKDPPPLKIGELVKATERKSEDVIAETETQLYRAALDENHSPSLNIVGLILYRLKADMGKFGSDVLETPISRATLKKIRDSNHPIPPAGESRFALLRLILNRNANRRGELMIEPEVFETDDIPYNCGRLLAVFSLLQKAAHRVEADGKRREFEGAGVVERYYGAASTAPNRTFAVLWKLHHNHLRKLASKGESGRRAAQSFEKRIEEIVSRLPHTTFQSSFNLQEQGRFALGFYQQKALERQQLNERIAARKAQQQSDATRATSETDEVDLDELLSDT